jgi:hypothetical protein
MSNNFKDYNGADDQSLARGGFTKQEFTASGELEDVEPDDDAEEEPSDAELMEEEASDFSDSFDDSSDYDQ